jgi:peptide/nickel transport system ATP-binding protein
MSTAARRAYPAYESAPHGEDDALAVLGLTVAYRVRGRDREVLHDVTFRVRRGELSGSDA